MIKSRHKFWVHQCQAFVGNFHLTVTWPPDHHLSCPPLTLWDAQIKFDLMVTNFVQSVCKLCANTLRVTFINKTDKNNYLRICLALSMYSKPFNCTSVHKISLLYKCTQSSLLHKCTKSCLLHKCTKSCLLHKWTVYCRSVHKTSLM